MSTPQVSQARASQARLIGGRLPKLAQAAASARLKVAPAPVSALPRGGFIALVAVVLVLGVVGLLAFNTSMQQASFVATRLDAKAAHLKAQQQTLELELAALQDPQQVALAARQLGMVPPPAPAFVQLSSGEILGDAQVATGGDFMRITPLPAPRPKSLIPDELIVTVKPTKAQLRRAERERIRAQQDQQTQRAEVPRSDSGGR